MTADVQKFIAALSDPCPWHRRSAVVALGDLGDRAAPAVGSLVALLDDQSPHLREAAAAALARMGSAAEPALPALAQLAFGDGDSAVRGMAVRALGGIQSCEAVGPLSELLGDCAIEIRFYAALALASLGPLAGNAVPALIGVLSDPDPAVRRTAACALGLVGSEAGEAIPPLIAMLTEDEDTGARKNAAVALGWIGRSTHGLLPGIEQGLVRALRDSDFGVHRSAIRALRHLRPEQENL